MGYRDAWRRGAQLVDGDAARVLAANGRLDDGTPYLHFDDMRDDYGTGWMVRIVNSGVEYWIPISIAVSAGLTSHDYAESLKSGINAATEASQFEAFSSGSWANYREELWDFFVGGGEDIGNVILETPKNIGIGIGEAARFAGETAGSVLKGASQGLGIELPGLKTILIVAAILAVAVIALKARR